MLRAALMLLIAFYFLNPYDVPPVLAQESSEDYITLDKYPEIGSGGIQVTYPESAKKDSVQGTVYVKMTVTPDGKATEVHIEKGVRKDLDDAAMEAVRSVKWKPAEQKGKPIECSIVLPIKFKLADKKK
ncbi:energy transducer TonB [candidate division KSB1 bacterium]|nr:MAG: energy transducer TonB [candidate division KSB1 bacterium]